MKSIDNIIRYFISLDTKQIISEIVDLLSVKYYSKEEYPTAICTILLAVQDVKYNIPPSKKEDYMYMEIYNKTKEIMLKDN